MPPALDETLEKDHGIQIPSSVLTRDVDSTEDMDAPSKTVNDSYPRFWFNLSSLTALDFCSIKSLLELTEMPLQSLFNDSASCKIDLQPSLGALLGTVSADKSGADCPLLNEDSGLKERTASKEEPRTVLKDQTLPRLLYFQTKSKPLSSGRSSGNTNSNQSNALRPEWHVASRGAMQEKVDARRTRLASQLHALATRTDRAKLRLHALLGENTLQSINKQLEDIKGILSPTSTKSDPDPDPLSPADHQCANASGVHEKGDCLPDHFSQQAFSTFSGPAVRQGSGNLSSCSESSLLGETAESVQFIRSVQSLVRCGQEVLHKAQQNLDSDATESSSDDEWGEESKRKRPGSGCLGCEWRYQCERAKLASQWTWMKLRLSELDSQIQRVSHLHQHLLTNKEGVVLAEAQLLTDLQIQQTLLTETAGLTLAAGQTHDPNSELDTEPSSPTRLLRNIERQSAQLSQIVNSLMFPLSDSFERSSVAKGAHSGWRSSRKRPFNSTGTDTFLQSGSTRTGSTDRRKRQVGRRSQLRSQVDVTHACARTRPLLTYHKPRLFIADQTPVTQQAADSPAYRFSNSTNKSNAINSMLKLKTFFKEDWLHRSRSIILPRVRFTTAEKSTSSIFDCTHKLQTAQSHGKVTRTQDTPKVKRRCQRGPDIDMCVSRTGTISPGAKDSPEEVLTPYFANLHQRKSQFLTRRRNGESVYNINNIVVPMSLAASTSVEKLQYKHIPTPRWRIVELSPLEKKEQEMDMNKVESLSDEVFIQRHQSYERREKHSWSSWEKGRRCTHRTRFSNSTDVPSDCEPKSWTCSTPTDEPQDNMEEQKPQPPWERRMFPLSETDQEALRHAEDTPNAEDAVCSKNQEMDSSLSDSSCKNSVSTVCASTPPPAGQTRNNKRTVTFTSHTDFFSTLSYRSRGLQSRL